MGGTSGSILGNVLNNGIFAINRSDTFAFGGVISGAGGFAQIAYPAERGSTGVMSFIVNHDGVVFSKDLGPDTEKLATEMKLFDPDETWKREEIELLPF